MYKDLYDHGAISYDNTPRGYTRDLPDTDLSDHGALSYDSKPKGYTRDLIDTDLSDHGALAYEPRINTWGTNDEEIIKQINILTRASYYQHIKELAPLLTPASMAKIVNYRYRQIANILENSRNGLSKDEMEILGTNLYLDFLIIDNLMKLNPGCLEEVFNPSLYIGNRNNTNIYGVIEKYKQDLEKLSIQIPLINGETGKPLIDENGKKVTAQEILNYLMEQNITLEQENTQGRKL